MHKNSSISIFSDCMVSNQLILWITSVINQFIIVFTNKHFKLTIMNIMNLLYTIISTNLWICKVMWWYIMLWYNRGGSRGFHGTFLFLKKASILLDELFIDNFSYSQNCKWNIYKIFLINNGQIIYTFAVLSINNIEVNKYLYFWSHYPTVLLYCIQFNVSWRFGLAFKSENTFENF